MVGKYVDLQVNGYVGVDFNCPRTTVDDLRRAAVAMRDDGVSLAWPTVITASLDDMALCIGNLRDAIEECAEVRSVFQGIHVEGPFLSPQPGYIGAHPVAHALTADPAAMGRLIDAGGGHVRLVTLAPEIDENAALTDFCVSRSVHVAAGHTDASVDQLQRCIDVGLSLFTHLGNGCPRQMDRHDNIIYRALHLCRQLHFSLIGDGIHLTKVLFQNLLRWIPENRIIIVSDAISAAGLGPGDYALGEQIVRVGEDRAVRDPGGEHFVGSAARMRDADAWLTNHAGVEQPQRTAFLHDNPLRFAEAGMSSN